MYRVIKRFIDLQDDNHEYKENDEFPRKGLNVSELRLSQLSSNANRQKTPLIVEVKDLAKSLDSDALAQSEKIEQDVPQNNNSDEGASMEAEKKVAMKRSKKAKND